jgi:hypothetical protein
MKLIKTANNKYNLRISKSEWLLAGRNAGWIKEAQHVFPVEIRQMFDDLESSGFIRIEGKGPKFKVYPNAIDPRTNKFFPMMPVHTTPDHGKLLSIVKRLKASCPGYTKWPSAYSQGARNKTKNKKKPEYSCEKCGHSDVNVDKTESSFTYIKCLNPSCGHTGIITPFI